ncbi:MAG: YdeI/OmpD-associated family protein [Actinomycetota bacterium]|nr:YdeI/OmpD-associated family protein [Actinomycetota bacterium]
MSQADATRVHVETTEEWRAWLAEHHLTETCVWLVAWRTATGRPFPPYENQIEEALRVGWVDSTAKRLDDERSMLYFARRRPGSGWARTNKARIARLEAEGKMLPAGRAVVDRARADGSWTLLDDVEALVVPDDLAVALDGDQRALAHWNGFAPSARKQILWWITQAKRPATRAARIEQTVQLASRGERAR